MRGSLGKVATTARPLQGRKMEAGRGDFRGRLTEIQVVRGKDSVRQEGRAVGRRRLCCSASAVVARSVIGREQWSAWCKSRGETYRRAPSRTVATGSTAHGIQEVEGSTPFGSTPVHSRSWHSLSSATAVRLRLLSRPVLDPGLAQQFSRGRSSPQRSPVTAPRVKFALTLCSSGRYSA